ncbi:MAG: SDR family oxidoreductase [Desulfuromonadales bacterium]|nr:SDR family oxidoreductase [Desulfuromonadales bacterium]
MKLKGKVAVVTGGGGAIGGASAELFAAQGAKVVVSDFNGRTAQQVVDKIRQAGGEAVLAEADVSKVPETAKIIQAAMDAFGRVDVLFNVAGVELVKSLHEHTEEDYDRVMGVSLKGSFFCAKYAVQQMMKQGSGVIINMGSIAALNGHAQLASYCAAKGALINFTKYLAIEYAPYNIRSNCICPGTIATEMVKRAAAANPDLVEKNVLQHPLGRMGEVREISDVALFLASDEASFITGVSIPVDGGYSAGKVYR